MQKHTELQQALHNQKSEKSRKSEGTADYLPATCVQDTDEEDNYNFSVLFFGFFAIYLGRTLILPLLPSYANAIWASTHSDDSSTKCPDDKQGLLAALFYLTYAASGIAFGPLSIRIGRKPVLLICIIGITLGFIGQAFATSYWTLVAARSFSGIFAAINGVAQSYISDVCKPQHVPKYTAKLGAVFGLVFGFGPLCGGMLAMLNQVLIDAVNQNLPLESKWSNSWRYKLSLLYAACFTFIVSFLMIFKLKESLPESLRVRWRSNKSEQQQQQNKDTNVVTTHEATTGMEQQQQQQRHGGHCGVEMLSMIAHPDFAEVSKVIMNVLDMNESNRVIKQIRFNMKNYENPEQVATEAIEACHLSAEYKDDIISCINEARYSIDTIPENKPLSPTDDKLNKIHILDDDQFTETAQGEDAEKFERDFDFIDYDEEKHDEDEEHHGGEQAGMIDFAALFEAMLPERERTREFKARLRTYMLCVLFITIIMDLATAGHATIFNLLNNGSSDRGLVWTDDGKRSGMANDMIFGTAWMLYGVSYSSCQLFYVRMQIKYGAFGTGAIGSLIKIIGCILIPLSTYFCKEKLALDPTLRHTAWIELLIHAPASILNGVGYGLSNTACQTIISDYAKRYDIRSVGNWLGGYMGSVAFGSACVILLGILSKSIGADMVFFVCAGCAFLSFLMYLWLAYQARDIPIVVDVKTVIQNDEKLAEQLDKLAIDEYVERSMSRISAMDATRLSTISQLTYKLSSRASSLSPPLNAVPSTPNLQLMQVMKTPMTRMLRTRTSSNMTAMSSEDGMLMRRVTDSITKMSLNQSLSSFNIATPMGPLPILTPSALIGLPIASNVHHHFPVAPRSSANYDGEKMIHIDLKNAKLEKEEEKV